MFKIVLACWHQRIDFFLGFFRHLQTAISHIFWILTTLFMAGGQKFFRNRFKSAKMRYEIILLYPCAKVDCYCISNRFFSQPLQPSPIGLKSNIYLLNISWAFWASSLCSHTSYWEHLWKHRMSFKPATLKAVVTLPALPTTHYKLQRSCVDWQCTHFEYHRNWYKKYRIDGLAHVRFSKKDDLKFSVKLH